MSVKRLCSLVPFLVFLLLSSAAVAQKAEVALTAGASSVTDTHIVSDCPINSNCLVVGPETVSTDHQVYFEATPAFRLLKAKVAAIYLESPFVGIPNQKTTFTLPGSEFSARVTSLYVTPGFKAQFLPRAFVSPWASIGGGWAHFAFPLDHTNKAALQFGGGADFKTPFPHLAFRVEVRDFLSGQPSFGTPGVGLIGNPASGLSRHNVLAGAGLVFHF